MARNIVRVAKDYYDTYVKEKEAEGYEVSIIAEHKDEYMVGLKKVRGTDRTIVRVTIPIEEYIARMTAEGYDVTILREHKGEYYVGLTPIKKEQDKGRSR